jgi:hypothetical protein
MPTYAEVRTKFLSRVRRRDCTSALADGFLQDAIKRIQRVLRIPAGEKSVEVTISDATYLTDGRLPIPSDFLKLKAISLNGEKTLKRRPLHEVLAEVEWGTEGTTWCFARQGSSWVFGPLPLEDDVVRVDYFSEYSDTSEDADESILLNVAEDLVVFGALSYACDHFEDKRGPRFEQRFVQILADLQQQGDDDELTEAFISPAFDYPADE